MSHVYIYKIKEQSEEVLAEKLKQTVENIFRETNISVSGKKVLVKPNMLGAFEPSRGATTDPRVVEAIVAVLVDKGASQIYVGDSPGGIEKGTLGTAMKCGLYQSAKGHFVNFNESVKMIPISSRFVKEINIAGIINEVDLVINVPKLKTHGYMGFTGCIKNMFGIVVGPGKAKLHFKAPTIYQFAELIVDIYQLRVPELNIVDALVAMEGTGPTSGPLRQLDMIFAGTDGLAIDTVMGRMIDIELEKVKYLGIAAKRGLGEGDFDKITIHGDFAVIDDFEKPITYTEVTNHKASNGLNPKGLTYLYQMSTMLPKLVRPELCNKCKRCIVNCPAQAIVLKEFPEIDYKKCISCFCCSELCHQDCYDILDNSEVFSKIFNSFENSEEIK